MPCVVVRGRIVASYSAIHHVRSSVNLFIRQQTECRLLTSLKPLVPSDAATAAACLAGGLPAGVVAIKCSHVICGDIIQQRDVIFGLC